jgi:hypothetical protein
VSTEEFSITTISEKLPNAIYDMCIAKVGTKVYLFGGRNNTSLTTINVFDTETEKIYTLETSFPKPYYGGTAVSIGSNVYLLGGIVSGVASYEISVFDTTNNTLTTLPSTTLKLPYNRANMSQAKIDGKVYLFGGEAGGYAQRDIFKFVYALPLNENNLAIVLDDTKNKFEILSGVTLGVGQVFVGNEENLSEEAESYLFAHDSWSNIEFTSGNG